MLLNSVVIEQGYECYLSLISGETRRTIHDPTDTAVISSIVHEYNDTTSTLDHVAECWPSVDRNCSCGRFVDTGGHAGRVKDAGVDGRGDGIRIDND
jgi:hypothetical protein